MLVNKKDLISVLSVVKMLNEQDKQSSIINREAIVRITPSNDHIVIEYSKDYFRLTAKLQAGLDAKVSKTTYLCLYNQMLKLLKQHSSANKKDTMVDLVSLLSLNSFTDSDAFDRQGNYKNLNACNTLTKFTNQQLKELTNLIYTFEPGKENRFAISAGQLNLRSPVSCLIATDGCRLSKNDLGLYTQKEISVLIPYNIIRVLSMLPNSIEQFSLKEEITLGKPENFRLCGLGKTMYFCLDFKEQPGQFPNYKMIYPAQNSIEHCVKISKESVLTTIKDLLCAYENKEDNIPLKLHFNGQLDITYKGNCKTGLPYEEILKQGKPSYNMFFTPKYFTQFLENLPKEEKLITFFIKEETAQILLKAGNCEYIVMPRRAT